MFTAPEVREILSVVLNGSLRWGFSHEGEEFWYDVFKELRNPGMVPNLFRNLETPPDAPSIPTEFFRDKAFQQDLHGLNNHTFSEGYLWDGRNGAHLLNLGRIILDSEISATSDLGKALYKLRRYCIAFSDHRKGLRASALSNFNRRIQGCDNPVKPNPVTPRKITYLPNNKQLNPSKNKRSEEQ